MGVGFLYPAFLRLFTILLLILYLLFIINEVGVGVRVGLGSLLDHFGEVGDRTWGVVALDFDLVFLS